MAVRDSETLRYIRDCDIYETMRYIRDCDIYETMRYVRDCDIYELQGLLETVRSVRDYRPDED